MEEIHFRLPPTAPLHCPVLPLCSLSAPPVLPRAPSMLPRARSMRPLAPSLLPLKRPCSLSLPGMAILDPKFGVNIMYIYMCQKIRWPSAKRLNTPNIFPPPKPAIPNTNPMLLLGIKTHILSSLWKPYAAHPPANPPSHFLSITDSPQQP